MNSGDTIQSRMPVDAEIQVMYAEGVSYLCLSNQTVWLGHPWHQYPTVEGRGDRASRKASHLRTRWCKNSWTTHGFASTLMEVLRKHHRLRSPTQSICQIPD